MKADINDTSDSFQTLALLVVAVLLLLTSFGNAIVLYMASLGGMLVLFIWSLNDRNMWLAAVSGLFFAIAVFGTASRVF